VPKCPRPLAPKPPKAAPDADANLDAECAASPLPLADLRDALGLLRPGDADELRYAGWMRLGRALVWAEGCAGDAVECYRRAIQAAGGAADGEWFSPESLIEEAMLGAGMALIEGGEAAAGRQPLESLPALVDGLPDRGSERSWVLSELATACDAAGDLIEAIAFQRRAADADRAGIESRLQIGQQEPAGEYGEKGGARDAGRCHHPTHVQPDASSAPCPTVRAEPDRHRLGVDRDR